MQKTAKRLVLDKIRSLKAIQRLHLSAPVTFAASLTQIIVSQEMI